MDCDICVADACFKYRKNVVYESMFGNGMNRGGILFVDADGLEEFLENLTY